MRSTTSCSGRSVTWGPCQLPQQIWYRTRSSGIPRRAWFTSSTRWAARWRYSATLMAGICASHLFGRIEPIFALVKGRDSGHERLLYPCALEGFLEVLYVSCNRIPLVGDSTGADLRRGCDRLGLPILVIKLWEFVPVSSPRSGVLSRPQRSRLEPPEALVGVGVEAKLPLLTVADDINATLHLLADRLGHGAAHTGCQGLVVIGVAALSCPDHLPQVWRTYQAADMGGENTLCAALHNLLLL